MATTEKQPPETADQESVAPQEPLTGDAVEEDGTPVLDEEDLAENDLTEAEADEIEWEEPKE